MALLAIKIPPGFYRNATQYQAKNRWYDGNLVRFSEGRLRPIGGWQRLADTQIVKKGAIKALTIVTAGTGYSAGSLSATGGGGSGFAGTYTVSGGAIATTTITNYGTGYTTAPTIVISHAGNGDASITATTFGTAADPIRGLHSWRLSTGARYLAVGSVQSLRIWDGSQSAGTNAPIYDISPASAAYPSGAIEFKLQEDFLIPGLGFGALGYGGDLGVTNFGSATATFTASSSSGLLITSTAHGLSDTTIVQVSTAGTLPTGLSASTDYYVRDKTTDTFRLATTSGGSAIAYTDAGTGTHSWITEIGITPGGDTFGGPRHPTADPDVTDIDAFRDNFAPVWSMDNFGDDLLACHSGEGTIWWWDVSGATFTNSTQTATAPTQLGGAPVSNVSVLVTPECHIMVMGADGNQRRIQWASQESLTDWTPTLVNTAGDLDLQTKGRIIGGFKTRYGVLVFTTSDVWKTNYLGPPYVYGIERLTEGGGPVGMKAVAGSADFVAWMSRGRFWSFTGGYVKELSCDVADYIFSNINLDVEGLIAAGHNPEFGEIIWFYPKEGDSYCTRYVTYSYREQHWTTGNLERTALEPSDALGYPVWAGSDGYLYRHEMDPDTQSTPIPRSSAVTAPADVAALSTMESRVVAKGVDVAIHPNVATEAHLCYAETGAIEIGAGNKMMNVRQIITDTDAGSKGLRMKATVADTPDGTGTEKGPYALESDGYTDTRFTGRQTYLKVESPFDQEWRFGEVRFLASVSGSR